MRQLFSKADLRDLGLVMAIVMLLASVPSAAAFVVISGPSRPELTINICQPIQACDRASKPLLARPAMALPKFVLCDLGSTAATETARLADCKVAPETPPPKRTV